MTDTSTPPTAPAWELGTRLGFDPDWQQQFDGVRSARSQSPRPGRVLRTHRVGFDVATPSGREFAIHRAERRNPLTAPATGDWVVVADVPNVEHPVMTTVLPRRTALVRRDPADRAAPQVLAANADVVVVAQAVDRPVGPRRLERSLALAHGSGAEVVIAVTKADLPDASGVVAALRQAAVGQTVIVTAAPTGLGVEQISALTAGNRTVVLLGESGAGKSSLINAVVGTAVLQVGVVRDGDKRGRHTTTRRELHPLDTGGSMLDTPGVRAVALWPDHTGLNATFPHIAEAEQDCRFADCTHDHEPGCAVRAAVGSGAIEANRLASWRMLVAEIEATRRQLETKDWR